MSARKQALTNPKRLSDGVSVTAITLSYVYFNDENITVYTKQGLSQTIPYSPKVRRVLIDIEDDLKTAIDVPDPI